MKFLKFTTHTALLSLCFASTTLADQPANPETKPTPAEKAADMPADLQAALEKLELPGVKINVKEWAVDVEATIALQAGLLELIACTKDTKEHESIIMIEAKPSHIHTALLLLGAKPGNPAMRRIIGEDTEQPRFIDIPPRGHPVDVYLIFEKEPAKEHPISEFLIPADHHDATVAETAPEDREKFPTHTFLFAGSVLYGEGDAPKVYLADQSGSVISLATFGDELLCLPGVYDDANASLMWQANEDKLPEIGTKTILRLRPQRKLAAGDGG